MRVVVQRVARASVSVDDRVVGAIDHGLLLLVGIEPDDDERDVDAMADKVLGLRIFADDDRRMNLDVGQVGGGVLVVSQFTLSADVRRGRRPSFTGAAPPQRAEPLVQHLADRIAEAGVSVETGVFGATMQVESVNDGPVTIVVDVHDGRVG